MADDQTNKGTTIDNLVQELSKNNSQNQSPATMPSEPPPNLPGVKIENKPTVLPPFPRSSEPLKQPIPPRSQSSISTSMPSKSPVSMPTRPATPPPPLPEAWQARPSSSPMASSDATKPLPVQEYRSSIRTMNEDIASIKSGQKPLGVDIPRKVTQEIPKSSLSAVPKPEITRPSASRPSIVSLGKAEKTGPLPSMAIPKEPTELSKPPEIQPSVSIPDDKRRFGVTMLYLLIAGIFVIGGFLYWYLILRVSEPEVTISPIPEPTRTVTPTPMVKSFKDMFGRDRGFEFSLFDIGLSKKSDDFKVFVKTLKVPDGWSNGSLLGIDLVQEIEGTLIPLNWIDMFDMNLTFYPSDLRVSIVDSATLVYGQSEIYKKDGTVGFNAKDFKKTVFVARITDTASVDTMMRDWERTISSDLADYLLIDDSLIDERNINFKDNTYRDVAIRYKNFPFPDTAVDYAVFKAAGHNYLLIAGSRESMYAVIDVLMELEQSTTPPSSTPLK